MLADLVYARCEWGEHTRLLDFGCGRHGNIATALCQYTDQTVAVDSSTAAVDAFNTWCDMQGLDASEVCAMTADAFANVRGFRQYFDIVVASLVFHHIELPLRGPTAAMLRERLRSGGVFVLIDVLRQDQSSDAINGFTQQGVRELLARAGYANVTVELGPRITLHNQKRTRLVIATASN